MAQPLMPKATTVWLVENTSLTFEQIAVFCDLHTLDVQGIADDEVATGIQGLDPIARNQLTREEIDRCEADPSARLQMAEQHLPQPLKRTTGPRYTPAMAESIKKISRSEETAGKTFVLEQATESLNREFALPENSGDLEAFLQANEAIMKGMAALSSEMMDFSNRRLGEFTKSESLVGCKDVDQAFRIQCEFAQTATQQYLDQTTNMLSIMTKMTQDFLNPLQELTRQALRDLTKETRSSKHT